MGKQFWDNEHPGVFVVTSGCYSDYSIEAVFSTREGAARLAETEPGFNIEEFHLDSDSGQIAVIPHHCRINLLDGTVLEEQPGDSVSVGVGERGRIEYYPQFRPSAVTPGEQEIYYVCEAVSYVDAAHAQKLAVEGRQAWLRAGSPINDTELRRFDDAL